MQRVNVSTKQMGRFAGKWVAIDTAKNRIIAAGKTLEKIASLVTGTTEEKNKILAAAFKVPRRDEGPYILGQQFLFLKKTWQNNCI